MQTSVILSQPQTNQINLLTFFKPRIDLIFFKTPLPDRLDRRDFPFLDPLVNRAFLDLQIMRKFIDCHQLFKSHKTSKLSLENFNKGIVQHQFIRASLLCQLFSHLFSYCYIKVLIYAFFDIMRIKRLCMY